eukprot:m.266538 g.266538  ORF g.266538 m.266538 type:complete len:119 (+) comp40501_c1_seq40:79-435(+)
MVVTMMKSILSPCAFFHLLRKATPEFAHIMCDDLDLPAHLFVPAIAGAIRQHCEQFSPNEIACDEEDRRVIVKLNIHIGNTSLTDQFEWDMSNPDNIPEEFARRTCADLGINRQHHIA